LDLLIITKGLAMKKATWLLVAGIFCYFIVTFVLNCAGEKEKRPLKSEPRVDSALEIARVWSGQHVGFYLLTKGNHQVVAYYDPDWRMTVAIRTLDAYKWDYYPIPDTPILGWSSHKDIALAFDGDGYLHVSGNMHGSPLIYFTATKPYDIYSLKRVAVLVDTTNEKKVTYPKFVSGASGEFIFHYRDGSSGKGNEIYNVYDEETKTWRRLLDTPLIDGEGKRNAYSDLKKGPDGYFHLGWAWRDTPDCITNHDLSYARSKDMLNWETVEGKPITLPITYDTKGVIVDPIPIDSGFFGGSIGFDSKNRPVILSIKFDENGMTQAYNARFEKGKWKIYQTSDWNYRWYFHGFGAIEMKIGLSPVVLTKDGYLTQGFGHWEHGSGTWLLDEKTLKPTGTIEMTQWPEELIVKEDHTGLMQINWKKDAGESGYPNLEYVLRWETLPPNRDRQRQEAPKPSTLRIYGLRYGSQ
jgi:hypothetical protein